jgi:hypothetical protein
VKWTQFVDAGDVGYFYGAGTMRRFDNGKIRVDVLEDHPAPVIDRRSGQDFVSAKRFWELDCNLKTVVHLSVAEFSGHQGSGVNLTDTTDGKVYADPQTLHDRGHEEDSASVDNIAPGSPEASLLGLLCR